MINKHTHKQRKQLQIVTCIARTVKQGNVLESDRKWEIPWTWLFNSKTPGTWMDLRVRGKQSCSVCDQAGMKIKNSRPM